MKTIIILIAWPLSLYIVRKRSILYGADIGITKFRQAMNATRYPRW